MKIAIMGAGGLGGFYGAMLGRAGHDVHLIARGEHLHAMQSGGLHVESESLGDFHLPAVQATDDPGRVGVVDAVLMGVKAYDLTTAGEAIRPLLGEAGYVLPLLNGVDIAERIGAVVGMDRLIGGTVFLSCNLIAPGRLRHVFNGRMAFGELAGGRSERCDALEAALQEAGVVADQSTDIRKELWHKFSMMAPLAGVSGVSRVATRAMIGDSDTRGVFAGAVREVAALAAASGISLPDDLTERNVAFAEQVDPRHTVSLLLDLRAGRRLELDILQGTIVRLGRELGVPTPVNDVLYACLKPHAQGPPRETT